MSVVIPINNIQRTISGVNKSNLAYMLAPYLGMKKRTLLNIFYGLEDENNELDIYANMACSNSLKNALYSIRKLQDLKCHVYVFPSPYTKLLYYGNRMILYNNIIIKHINSRMGSNFHIINFDKHVIYGMDNISYSYRPISEYIITNNNVCIARFKAWLGEDWRVRLLYIVTSPCFLVLFILYFVIMLFLIVVDVLTCFNFGLVEFWSSIVNNNC